MELGRFGRLLVIHGANLAEWPDAERRQAEALLARSPEAARLRDESARMDRILRDAGPVVSPETVERVLARIDARIDASEDDDDIDPDAFFAALPRPIRGPWISAAILASMIVIGFLIGVNSSTESRQSSDFVDLLSSRSASGYGL
ncbi:MAG TPA: hypothetical protein VGG27_11840 [Magnetospirillaceae bacterium]|jgi:hypothetical protein